MASLFVIPDLDLDDQHVIEVIHGLRAQMASLLRVPRRWSGGLRRTARARAIQGSNSIEGYTVSDQDAAAAVEDEPPLMTLRAMHFMLLEHDLSKSPGQYRTREIYVRDDTTDTTVHEGPDSDLVPDLMETLAATLAADRDVDPVVRAAMAHLNLVMIHPFRDGNGRMARALQTMVLAQDSVIEPTFSSIEEWLGANTSDYYRVLAATGQGAWHPENDAHLWVKLNLRAHHMQAQTLQRRFEEAERLWSALDALVAEHRLPDRVADPLFDALVGVRVQRSTYIKRTELEKRTATRDLAPGRPRVACSGRSDAGALLPRR